MTVKEFSFDKEHSLRKLLKQLEKNEKQYEEARDNPRTDGYTKQYLAGRMRESEIIRIELEKVLDRTPQLEKTELATFLLELLPEKLLLDRKQLSEIRDNIIAGKSCGSDTFYDFVSELLEGSGEPLNLALPFADVKKKKGFGEKK